MTTTTFTAIDALIVAALVRGDDDEAEILEGIDLGPRAARTTTAVAAALWYAKQGWPVFPLTPGEKKPLRGSHGLHDATVDPTQIRTWWEATPDANVGLPTGKAFDVFDFDGDPDGAKAFQGDAVDEGGKVPDVLGIVATPRGMHLYVPPDGGGNAAGIYPGVDYRGKGGYVVAPPSATPTATYRWLLAPRKDYHL